MDIMEIELIEKASEFFKALSDPTRLKIIDALFFGEKCVSSIANDIGMTQSAVSHQLKILKNAKIIKSKKNGKNVFYSLVECHVEDIIRNTLEHLQH